MSRIAEIMRTGVPYTVAKARVEAEAAAEPQSCGTCTRYDRACRYCTLWGTVREPGDVACKDWAGEAEH